MKKLFSLLAALMVVAFGLPAMAAVTTSTTSTRYMSAGAVVDLYTGLLTASGPDTAGGTYLSPAISNVNGDIRSIAATVAATNSTGGSTTLTIALYASFTQGGSYFPVRTYSSGTGYLVSGPATDITSTAGGSSGTVQAGIDTNMYGISQLAYPYYKIGVVLGGTGTPGWSGTVFAAVKRQASAVR